MVLFPAARNGSVPAPIPLKELKLLCPPPGNPCYYCVFHNLISFLVVSVLSSFLIKYKTFFGHTLALLPLSSQKILYLIKRCYCFVLSVYVCSSSLPLRSNYMYHVRVRVRENKYFFLICSYRFRLDN